MSDKPKVYQGVRVKTTVKELLQRHRAREANRKKLKPIGQSSPDLQDLSSANFLNVSPTTSYVDPPAAITAPESGCCDTRALQLRSIDFQALPDSSCNIQMHGDAFNDVQQQVDNMTFPGNCYSGNSSNNSSNNSNSIGGCNNVNTSMPPSHSFSLQWFYGLSQDSDYYGNGMAPGSPSESRRLYSPVDHNSYSPQDSFSSSSSSCYNSPTRMETSHPGFTPEHHHYQHCNLQDCYCLPHYWPVQQESFSAPEYLPYCNPTYPCPAEENYFMRDVQMPEMCYNVL